MPASGPRSRRLSVISGLATITTAAVLVGLMATPASAAAQPAPIRLLSASTFSVLASAAATLPGSTLPSEVGAAAAITDDANTHYGSTGKHAVNDGSTKAALSDLKTVYSNLSGLAATGTLSGDDLTGQTVYPGVYHRVAAYAMTTPVTFDARGDRTANFVMQSDAALNTTAGTTMNLINGAQASHIFWVTRGAATLGASSHFFGTMVSWAAITVGASSTVCGRALSVTAAVTLDADVFSCVASADELLPTIAITSLATTPSTTPTITGTSTAPAGSAIVVTIGTDTETTTVGTGGAWTVTARTAQSTGPVQVVATVTDPGGYTATASQTLTIRVPVALPKISITSSPSVTTANPAISGTSDAPNGSPIVVTIGGQTLRTTVVAGKWSVTPAALKNGSYDVSATVTTSAGVGTAAALLTVGVPVALPKISITSSPPVTTANPVISGTSDAPNGSPIVVTIGGQTLRTTVVAAKWSVTPAALKNGSYFVSATVTTAGGSASASQNLQICVPKLNITVNGGSSQSVNCSCGSLSLSGSTNAPVGSKVTVLLDGLTRGYTTTVTAGGQWSLSIAGLMGGKHSVKASVTDASGNTVSTS